LKSVKKAAVVLFAVICLGAGGWWFLADEELEPATQAWLEAPRAGQDAEGLDFLFFMGLMAPPGADPIEHARDLIRQHEEDFDLRIDYLPDLMAGSPCEIDDWACWDSDNTSWVADTLVDYAHVLDRWYSLPVHHDFGAEPIMRWLLGVLAPSNQLLDHLITLQLIDAKRNQRLDELALKALEQSAQLSSARPVEGNSVGLLIFELLKSQSVRHILRAVRFGAEPPDQERLDQFMAHQLPVADQLVAWTQLEFDRFHYTWPRVHRDFSDRLLDKENRTLNRARACLEQVIELADPAKLFEFMEAEVEICGPDWRSRRNWHGDELVDHLVFGRNDIACRVHGLAHRDDLAIALLAALAVQDTETARLAEVARANPYYPERGAFLKEDQVCFESLGPGCGETCLPAPWPVTPSTE
jgi:hypothetical protein